MSSDPICAKEAFPAREVAQASLRNAIRKAREGLPHRREKACYRCDLSGCGAWHLTSLDPNGSTRFGPGYEPRAMLRRFHGAHR